MILATQGDKMERRMARHYQEDRAVVTSEEFFWNIKSISPMGIIVPDILNTLYLSILKHLMHWLMFFLKKDCRIDKVNQFWAIMPSYPGFA
jgi:hypothetical protein